MQLDDLKETWKQEVAVNNISIDFGALRQRVDKIDRQAKITWATELIACAVIILISSIIWVTAMAIGELHPMFHLGIFAMIASPAFVAWKIIRSRRVSTADDWTLAAKLNIQIEKREKDAKLLNSVAFWYLGPLFFAVILASYGGYVQRTGSYIPDSAIWIYWAACLALYLGIYLLNRYSAKTNIQPVLTQLYALKRELESERGWVESKD